MDFSFHCVGIVGMGLIGGSMAKTIRNRMDAEILGYNRTIAIEEKAVAEGVINDSLRGKEGCPDLFIVSLYPDATVEYVKSNLNRFKKGCVIVDCCGTKTKVCKELSALCDANGIFFVGGHPMAGIEKSGYDYSFDGLFNQAAMILCRDEYTNEDAYQALKQYFIRLGFGRIRESDYKEHDQVIAFTSQMAHVVSNAYIKSPTCNDRYGFSAGSFKDLTRVAYLNETMWTELFMENREALLHEIKFFLKSMEAYETALENNDYEGLKQLLRDGRICKEKDNENERNGK